MSMFLFVRTIQGSVCRRCVSRVCFSHVRTARDQPEARVGLSNMASRKRNKAPRGKKASLSSVRSLSSSSSKGDDSRDSMPDLKEAKGTTSTEASTVTESVEKAISVETPTVVVKKAEKASAAARGGGLLKTPAARMVYFDPQKVLPSGDKRAGEAR